MNFKVDVFQMFSSECHKGCLLIPTDVVGIFIVMIMRITRLTPGITV